MTTTIQSNLTVRDQIKFQEALEHFKALVDGLSKMVLAWAVAFFTYTRSLGPLLGREAVLAFRWVPGRTSASCGRGQSLLSTGPSRTWRQSIGLSAWYSFVCLLRL